MNRLNDYIVIAKHNNKYEYVNILAESEQDAIDIANTSLNRPYTFYKAYNVTDSLVRQFVVSLLIRLNKL